MARDQMGRALTAYQHHEVTHKDSINKTQRQEASRSTTRADQSDTDPTAHPISAVERRTKIKKALDTAVTIDRDENKAGITHHTKQSSRTTTLVMPQIATGSGPISPALSTSGFHILGSEPAEPAPKQRVREEQMASADKIREMLKLAYLRGKFPLEAKQHLKSYNDQSK